MTRLIVETNNEWAKNKIQTVFQTETSFLRKVLQRTQQKVHEFEHKYGTCERESLYGRVDDMEMVEWEGQLETVERLKQQLQSFEEMTFEYR